MKNLSYNECIDLINCELENIDITLKEYCKIHNLNYTLLVSIKNKKLKMVYPNFIINVLKSLNYNVTKSELFIIDKK